MNIKFKNQNKILFLDMAVVAECTTLSACLRLEAENNENAFEIDESIVSFDSLVSLGMWLEWHLKNDANFPKTEHFCAGADRAAWSAHVQKWLSEKPAHVIDYENHWFDNCVALAAANRKQVGILGDILCTADYLDCEQIVFSIARSLEQRKIDSSVLASLLFF